MDNSNIVTLIFVVASVFIFLQLRNVLGKRTGHERRRDEGFSRSDVDSASAGESDNVITLPGRGVKPVDQYREIDKVAKVGTDLNKNLRAIKDAAPQFDATEFLSGARMAYEMIVMAFADADRKTLKNLLSQEVYEGFDAALLEREERKETVRTNFVGIESLDYLAAEMRGHDAHITVKVVSQLITSTVDEQGDVVDGDAEAVVEVDDVWTFARDTRDRNPNWKLVATEAE